MTRILKFIIYSILGLILLVVGAIAATLMILDPNDYKPDIEKAVADNSQLTLKMTGDLSWSLMPLGINVGKLSASTPDAREFTALEQLTAEIDLMSLFRMTPRVQRIIIDGLTLNLHKDAKGVANWTQIAKPKTADTAPATTSAPDPQSPPPAGDTPDSPAEKKAPLEFKVDEVAVTNTTVNYQDDQSGQKVSLKKFNLVTSNIGLDREFPLSIDFGVQNQTPKLDIDAAIKLKILVASSLKQIKIPAFDARLSLAGAPFADKTVKTSTQAALAVDLETETLELEKFLLSFANLELKANAKVKGFGAEPKVNGQVDIAPFSLQNLLESTGQAAIVTSDANVLQKLGFSTLIAVAAKDIQLSELKLTLDDTLYTGKVAVNTGKPYFSVTLAGTELNVDRYLPPVKEAAAKTTDTAGTPGSPAPDTTASAGTASAPEAPLLPLETIRGLNFDVNFTQQRLLAKNLKLNELKVVATGAKGLIELKEASGKMYEGGFAAAVRIDARTDDVKWEVTKKVTNIQTGPLLTDLLQMDMLSGGVNLDANVKTRGNTVSALKANAKGEAGFNLDKGSISGFNLTALTCEAFALINKEKVSTRNWPAKTDFQSMQGRLLIDGNTYTNKPLVAALSGLELAGEGVIQMDTSTLNYGAELKVVGNLGENACRVNERVTEIPIPVRCKGKLSAPECGLDTERLGSAITSLAKKELERKATKEIDKQVDKQVEKHLDKYLGGDEEKEGAKKEIKKLLKGLF